MLSVNNLVKYYGDTKAADHLNFELQSGEITALIGENGSGKSTLLRLISGRSIPDEGEVRIENTPLQNYRSLSKILGFFSNADAIHPSWTVEDHLHIIASLTHTGKEDIEKIITTCNLMSFRHLRGKELSLGMRQRLGIALSILNNPKILILDEPSNGLDSFCLHRLYALLKAHSQSGGATIFSSHVISDIAQIADRLLILYEGKIIWDSSIKSFIESRSTPQVIVQGRNLSALESELTKRGLSAIIRNRCLIASGISQEEIGELAFNCRTVVTGLHTEQASLEDLYLNLLTEYKVTDQ